MSNKGWGLLQDRRLQVAPLFGWIVCLSWNQDAGRLKRHRTGYWLTLEGRWRATGSYGMARSGFYSFFNRRLQVAPLFGWIVCLSWNQDAGRLKRHRAGYWLALGGRWRVTGSYGMARSGFCSFFGMRLSLLRLLLFCFLIAGGLSKPWGCWAYDAKKKDEQNSGRENSFHTYHPQGFRLSLPRRACYKKLLIESRIRSQCSY